MTVSKTDADNPRRLKQPPDPDPSDAAVLLARSAPKSDEGTIVARLNARDELIIGELVQQYQDRLRRYLIHLTQDRDIAEDILQDTWARVITRGWQFKGNSQFTTWLFAVARNLVRDERRKQRIQAASLEFVSSEGEEIQLEVPSPARTPFENAVDGEHKQMLKDAISGLTPHHRQVLELHLFGEMSLGDISRITGDSPSTVKTRFYRARSILKRLVRTSISQRHLPA